MAYDVRFLSEADVAALGISMKEVLDAVDTGWKLNGEGKVENPPKIGVHPRHDAYMHAMPCWLAETLIWLVLSGYAAIQRTLSSISRTIMVSLSSALWRPVSLRLYWTAIG